MTATFPQVVRLEPPGLTVHVHLHRIGDRACWSYVSQGMAAHDHPEMILTVKREPEDDEGGLLRHALELMALLFERARAGERVSAGQYTELGPSGFFGREDFRGIVHLLPQEVEGVTGLDDTMLAMLVITGDELAVVKDAGVMRVVARLAESTRYFPYPPWCDRQRTSTALLGEDKSLIPLVARFWFAVSHVAKIDDAVTLVLPRAHAPAITAQLGELAPDKAVAFLTMPPPEATAALVWRPGQKNPEAYALEGADLSRLGGNFCLFVPEQPLDAGQIHEDGFGVMLRDSTWRELRDAIASVRDFDVAASGAPGFALRWH